MSNAGQIISIRGYSTDIDAAVEDLSINNADNDYLTQPGGVGLDIVSAAAGDDVGSTGIEIVRLHYLDTAWAQQTEDISMNGAGTVSTTATDILRVQYMEAVDVGSGGVAAGAIILTEDGGVVSTYLQIATGGTQSQNGYYYVPAGRKLYLSALYPAVLAAMAEETQLHLGIQRLADANAANVDAIYIEDSIEFGVTENVAAPALYFNPPIIVGPKCRVRMRALASAVNQTLSCQMRGVLVPDTHVYRP